MATNDPERIVDERHDVKLLPFIRIYVNIQPQQPTEQYLVDIFVHKPSLGLRIILVRRLEL
jgi:hypothetical protein